MIYHMTHKSEWEEAQKKGYYLPTRYIEDGFIHASTAVQVLDTANRRYKADNELVLLAIDESKVPSKIVFEDLSNRGEKHPHIYGQLPIEAVVDIYQLLPGVDGNFEKLPDEILTWEVK